MRAGEAPSCAPSPLFRLSWEKLVDSNTTSVTKGAHLAYYRKVQGAIQQPCRSLSRGALIVIVLLSFGLWGIIWLAVALLASVWER
jgi:hypothetical protein